jgi:hypothetical protein
MKTLLKISNDYFSECAENEYTEDINVLVNELNVKCYIKNNDYLNIVEEQQNYTPDEEYNNHINIVARCYSQSEWQEFTLYYNDNAIKNKIHKSYLESLIEQLKKYFTHKNNYFCQKFEYIEKDNKIFMNNEAFDMTSFSITHTEFPNEEDIKKAYSDIYGDDFDKIEINID